MGNFKRRIYEWIHCLWVNKKILGKFLYFYRCASIDKIKAKVSEWKDELKDNSQFRNFYNFVFDYLKEDKKILLTEDAVAAWKIVLKDNRKWGLFVDFTEFLTAEDKKSVSRDAWQQLWHFMISYPNSLKDYDVNCMLLFTQ
jgi:DCN1-like protein 1/2